MCPNRSFKFRKIRFEKLLLPPSNMGGAKVSEIVTTFGIDLGGGGAYAERQRFAEMFDLADFEKQLQAVAVEDPDGLWKLKVRSKAKLLR